MRPTLVYVGDVAIGLAVIEMSELVTMRYIHGKHIRESDYKPSPRDRYTYTSTSEKEIPSGRMRIIAFSPYGGVKWQTQWQETKSVSLRGQIPQIVAEIEAAAPVIVDLIAEYERKEEIRRKEEQERHERWLRQQDREAIARSISDSQTELRKIIDKWAEVVTVERFLAGVETTARDQSADNLPEIQQRLSQARTLLGTTDPLDFFRSWKTPVERYRPKGPTVPR